MIKTVKRICTWLIIASVFVIAIPVIPINAAAVNILIRPGNFDSLGNFSVSSYSGAFESINLLAFSEEAGGAEIAFAAPKGVYTIWLRTRDFPTNAPGSRNIRLTVNGRAYQKEHTLDNPSVPVNPSFEGLFGTHGYGRFEWEKTAESVIISQGGMQTLAITPGASNNYARVDAVIVTNTPSYDPRAKTITVLSEECTPPLKDTTNIYSHIMFRPESFADLGTWRKESSGIAFENQTLDAGGNPPYGAASSVHYFEKGNYNIWVRTRDYADDQAGARSFQVKINNMICEKSHAFDNQIVDPQFAGLFGTHGYEGFRWEKAKIKAVLPRGYATLSLDPAASPGIGFCQTDAVILTPDDNFNPEGLSYGTLAAMCDRAGPSDRGFILLPGSFSETGAWAVRALDGAYNNVVLQSTATEFTAPPPAAADIVLPKGAYTVWVRTRDFAANPRTRILEVWLNGVKYQKDHQLDNPALSPITNGYFGTHGYDGFRWERVAGQVALKNGNNRLGLIPKSAFARMDAVIITPDSSYNPETRDLQALLSENDLVRLPEAAAFEDDLKFPEWAIETPAYSNTAFIEGSNIRVDFFLRDAGASAPLGQRYFVHRRTTLDNEVIDNASDAIGYLLLYAHESEDIQNNAINPTFIQKTSTVIGGNEMSLVTTDPYRSGKPMWMIPSTLTQTAEKVVMTAENEYAYLTAAWMIPDAGAKEPKVTIDLIPKVDGHFSLGMFNIATEFDQDDVSYILSPFRYQEMRLPEHPVLLPEAYSSAALSQMTVKAAGSGIPAGEITYGVVADPSSVPHRWAYQRAYIPLPLGGTIDRTDEQSKFGLGITGPNGDVMPALFAPMFGTETSAMTAGSSFVFSYRPLAVKGGWYDCYSHVVNNVYRVTDYRNNYFSSLTDTAFNMYDLLKDDFHSGWSVDGKGHYNMERRNLVTMANRLAYLQFYLLTEDGELLRRRTIPSLEYILSRPRTHFAFGDITGSNFHDDQITSYGRIGIDPDFGGGSQVSAGNYASAMQFVGSSAYAGLYQMTRGLMPLFRDIGATLRNTQIASPEQIGGTTNPSEHLWRTKMILNQSTADRSFQNAINAANFYIANRVNVPQREIRPESNFVFSTYYPHFHSLLEMYEATGNTDYLDAAKESARRLLPTLWTAPMPDLNKEITLSHDRVYDYNSRISGTLLFFRGDTRFRLGVEEIDVNGLIRTTGITDTARRQPEDPVPEWVPSRVGLGIEQASTFMLSHGNILMSTWAPDLMRLYKLTGDKNFEMFARNSLVGRYENYPGYYYPQLQTFQSLKDYPYVGPDFTSLYFHQIPVHLAAIQDFLISQAWAWSDGQVDFPNTRDQGYVWFNNRHYGFEPGRMFGETDMWLWFKRGLVTTDNKQIDWIGGRKDGRFAAVFMNASDRDVTTTVTFGDEIGANINTEAAVYGNLHSGGVAVTNNKCTITVPAKSTYCVAFDAPRVMKPSFSSVGYAENFNEAIGDTWARTEIIDDGNPDIFDVNAHVVQVDRDSYTAYVYTNHRPDFAGGLVRQVDLVYQEEGASDWTTVSDTVYPYEFSILMPDITKGFNFKVRLHTAAQGIKETAAPLLLKPLEENDPMPDIETLIYDNSLKKDGNTLSGDVNISVFNRNTGPVNISVVLALYDDSGQLVYVSIKNDEEIIKGGNPFDFQNISARNVKGQEFSVKAFAWRSVSSLKTLSQAAVLPLSF